MPVHGFGMSAFPGYRTTGRRPLHSHSCQAQPHQTGDAASSAHVHPQLQAYRDFQPPFAAIADVDAVSSVPQATPGAACKPKHTQNTTLLQTAEVQPVAHTGNRTTMTPTSAALAVMIFLGGAAAISLYRSGTGLGGVRQLFHDAQAHLLEQDAQKLSEKLPEADAAKLEAAADPSLRAYLQRQHASGRDFTAERGEGPSSSSSVRLPDFNPHNAAAGRAAEYEAILSRKKEWEERRRQRFAATGQQSGVRLGSPPGISQGPAPTSASSASSLDSAQPDMLAGNGAGTAARLEAFDVTRESTANGDVSAQASGSTQLPRTTASAATRLDNSSTCRGRTPWGAPAGPPGRGPSPGGPQIARGTSGSAVRSTIITSAVGRQAAAATEAAVTADIATGKVKGDDDSGAAGLSDGGQGPAGHQSPVAGQLSRTAVDQPGAIGEVAGADVESSDGWWPGNAEEGSGVEDEVGDGDDFVAVPQEYLSALEATRQSIRQAREKRTKQMQEAAAAPSAEDEHFDSVLTASLFRRLRKRMRVSHGLPRELQQRQSVVVLADALGHQPGSHLQRVQLLKVPVGQRLANALCVFKDDAVAGSFKRILQEDSVAAASCWAFTMPYLWSWLAEMEDEGGEIALAYFDTPLEMEQWPTFFNPEEQYGELLGAAQIVLPSVVAQILQQYRGWAAEEMVYIQDERFKGVLRGARQKLNDMAEAEELEAARATPVPSPEDDTVEETFLLQLDLPPPQEAEEVLTVEELAQLAAEEVLQEAADWPLREGLGTDTRHTWNDFLANLVHVTPPSSQPGDGVRAPQPSSTTGEDSAESADAAAPSSSADTLDAGMDEDVLNAAYILAADTTRRAMNPASRTKPSPMSAVVMPSPPEDMQLLEYQSSAETSNLDTGAQAEAAAGSWSQQTSSSYPGQRSFNLGSDDAAAAAQAGASVGSPQASADLHHAAQPAATPTTQSDEEDDDDYFDDSSNTALHDDEQPLSSTTNAEGFTTVTYEDDVTIIFPPGHSMSNSAATSRTNPTTSASVPNLRASEASAAQSPAAHSMQEVEEEEDPWAPLLRPRAPVVPPGPPTAWWSLHDTIYIPTFYFNDGSSTFLSISLTPDPPVFGRVEEQQDIPQGPLLLMACENPGDAWALTFSPVARECVEDGGEGMFNSHVNCLSPEEVMEMAEDMGCQGVHVFPEGQVPEEAQLTYEHFQDAVLRQLEKP